MFPFWRNSSRNINLTTEIIWTSDNKWTNALHVKYTGIDRVTPYPLLYMHFFQAEVSADDSGAYCDLLSTLESDYQQLRVPVDCLLTDMDQIVTI